LGYVTWCLLPESLLDRIPCGKAHLYQGVLIWCQSYYGDYAYSFGGATASDGDGMGSSTHVLVVSCAWVLDVLSY
jgi:hypothetical protein